MKATQGRSYRDPTFVHNFSNASLEGYQLGVYHFMEFDSHWHPVDEQMKNFVSALDEAIAASPVKVDKQQLIVALDAEKEYLFMAEDNVVSPMMEASVRYLKEKHNIIPYIYTRQNYWDEYVKNTPDIIKSCPLWIARYRLTPPTSKELPNGWREWKIWQHTEEGSVFGINGYVDENIMKT